MPDTNTTTFELANFVGELFEKGSRPNTFLQLIGGTTGADVSLASTEFPVGQHYSVPSHTTDRARREGQDAPDATGVTRSQVTNVTQIVQEAVVVSYTKQATSQMLSGLNVGGLTNPVRNELDFQTSVTLELIQRNLNWAFVNNSYAKPGNNNSARKTRGILSAITTNVLSDSGDRAISIELMETLLGTMLDNGAIADGENVFMMANTAQIRNINQLFRDDKAKADADRFVGGVRVRTIYTAFGAINLVLEQDMPQDEVAVVNFDAMKVVATPVPGKGVLFREELAKTGANEKYQIYGELGLDHGLEYYHGKITDLSTTLVGS